MTTDTSEKIGLTLGEIIEQSRFDDIKSIQGELFISTTDISYTNSPKTNWGTLPAGTATMLLSVSTAGGSHTARMLAGDKEILVGAINKLAYLEHGTALADISMCITGKLDHTRDFYKTLIEFQGGSFKKSVTRSVDYLVVGRDVGQNKLSKARSYGVKTLSQKEFFDLIIANKKAQGA